MYYRLLLLSRSEDSFSSWFTPWRPQFELRSAYLHDTYFHLVNHFTILS